MSKIEKYIIYLAYVVMFTGNNCAVRERDSVVKVMFNFIRRVLIMSTFLDVGLKGIQDLNAEVLERVHPQ